MHAIAISETGGPDVLTYVDIPVPTPGPGEVLIKAEAIGVNFIDTYFRTGLYPHPLPFILGSEVSGTVAAVGAEVTAFRVGDRVASADANRRVCRILHRTSRIDGARTRRHRL